MMGYTNVWKNDMKGLPSVNRKTRGVVMEIHKFLHLKQETITGWHKKQMYVTWQLTERPNINQSSHPTKPLASYIDISKHLSMQHFTKRVLTEVSVG